MEPIKQERGAHAKSTWRLCKRAASAWYADAIPRFSAALAFYTFFSLAPLLTITIAVSGIFFNRNAVEARVYSELKGFAGPAAAGAIQTLVRGAWTPGKDLWAVVLGLATLLVGATGVLNELQGALHVIWRVKGPRSAKVIFLNQTRMLAFLLGVAFLFVVSLMFDAGLAAFGQVYAAWLPWPETVLHALDLCFEWGMTIFIFAAIFKWLPDARITWRDVWTGSAFTSLLFLGGKFVLSVYLENGTISSVYGAAGSLTVVLIWVYYSALIFYFGAEFTKVYANTYGSHVNHG
jgi:membrane protein